GVPEKVTIDKSGSSLSIELRQSKYLNNAVEQDHRAVKRISRPMLGFKTFRCARILIAGIEITHTIRKGQLGRLKDRASSAAAQFYSPAF
ncbi:MAG: DDE-type integrase/transposase/recombinase, partial [Variovorax sp.]